MPIVSIRPLVRDDLSFGHRLSTEAGWNQLLADWERTFAIDSTASFIGSFGGVDVGTVVAVTFDAIAWVGLMLVDPAARGRGVGRALMERVLETLDARGVRTVRLDATPLGQPLYESLGFRTDFLLHRHAGIPVKMHDARVLDHDLRITAATEADIGLIADLDEQVTGTRRKRLLERLRDERPLGGRIVWRGDALAGFVFERAGRLGTLVGPCLGDSMAGAVLLSTTLNSLAGMPTLVDTPDDHQQARELATQYGLEAVRPLTRMTRGKPVREIVERLWASSGPEKG